MNTYEHPTKEEIEKAIEGVHKRFKKYFYQGLFRITHTKENFHFLVKANKRYAMQSKGQYSLIGCTVAPGFDYKDFELAPTDWKPTNFFINLL